MLNRAVQATWDFGGIPIPLPVIRLERAAGATPVLQRLSVYDWMVLASPSAVRFFLEGLKAAGQDVRRLPRLAVCGPATARELRAGGLIPDCEPNADFGVRGLLLAMGRATQPGQRVLRLCSDIAGGELTEGLRALGLTVDEETLYISRPIPQIALPPFDAAIFASASAVKAFIDPWGQTALSKKTIVAIGQPTTDALIRHGRAPDVIAPRESIEACLDALAAFWVNQALNECEKEGLSGTDFSADAI